MDTKLHGIARRYSREPKLFFKQHFIKVSSEKKSRTDSSVVALTSKCMQTRLTDFDEPRFFLLECGKILDICILFKGQGSDLNLEVYLLK